MAASPGHRTWQEKDPIEEVVQASQGYLSPGGGLKTSTEMHSAHSPKSKTKSFSPGSKMRKAPLHRHCNGPRCAQRHKLLPVDQGECWSYEVHAGKWKQVQRALPSH